MAAVQSQKAFVATIAGGVLVGAYLLWRRASCKASGDEEEEEWEPVARDHVVKFFQIINAQSNAQMASFDQQIAQYRGKIEERQLTDLAVGHFEDQLSKIQEQILSGMGISLEDMEDASKYYEAEGDAQVKEQMNTLKSLYLAVSNASTASPDLPDDLTAEKMVAVVNAFFKATNDCIRGVVEELIAQGKNLADPNTAMEMSMLLQQRSTPTTDEAVKPFNLDSTNITAAMEKFSDSPDIQNAIRVGTEEQRDILASYGLA